MFLNAPGHSVRYREIFEGYVFLKLVYHSDATAYVHMGKFGWKRCGWIVVILGFCWNTGCYSSICNQLDVLAHIRKSMYAIPDFNFSCDENVFSNFRFIYLG